MLELKYVNNNFKNLRKKLQKVLHSFEQGVYLHPQKLSDGVIGNTSDFGSEESRFET